MLGEKGGVGTAVATVRAGCAKEFKDTQQWKMRQGMRCAGVNFHMQLIAYYSNYCG